MQKSDTVVQMEAAMKKYTTEIFLTEEDIYDVEKRQPPRFVTQITQKTDLMEMQATKFECQLAPVGDPYMKVEWFFNGKPLPFSKSFNLTRITGCPQKLGYSSIPHPLGRHHLRTVPKATLVPPENRFTPIYDFGYVAMNFGWVYPEDSGEYVCRATNLYGSDETRGFINTAGRPGIIYESQLPKGMASIERIREMESGWQRAPGE